MTTYQAQILIVRGIVQQFHHFGGSYKIGNGAWTSVEASKTTFKLSKFWTNPATFVEFWISGNEEETGIERYDRIQLQVGTFVLSGDERATHMALMRDCLIPIRFNVANLEKIAN